jgi:N-carbamoylputrescine amidase
MRVTVCELPHETKALAAAWVELCQHTSKSASQLVLLPEFAMVDPLWESERFEPAQWAWTENLSDAWLRRLGELHATYVVGTRPASKDGRCLNQGYLWSAARGLAPLRSKFFLPAEEGNWETRWFDRGDPDFPAFLAGDLSFGLTICTELWALDTYAVYSTQGVQAILSPRATGAATTAKWLAVGVVAAVRSGAFSLSSNRVDPTGACGGVGWVISPDGKILATTSATAPFVSVDIDLAASTAARDTYPRYVFNGNAADRR